MSNKASRPLYEQISSQIKAAIMSGELKPEKLFPLCVLWQNHCKLVFLQCKKRMPPCKMMVLLKQPLEKGCYVSAQNQDFYLEEQQKKIEEKFAEAIEIARTSGISLDKLTDLLTLMYQEDDGE